MPHTPNRMQTYWSETRAFIQENWPKITDVDLDRINGNFDNFLFYLKQYYNNFPLNEAIARGKLQKFFNAMDDKQTDTKHNKHTNINTY